MSFVKSIPGMIEYLDPYRSFLQIIVRVCSTKLLLGPNLPHLYIFLRYLIWVFWSISWKVRIVRIFFLLLNFGGTSLFICVLSGDYVVI
jgi:hypothetical protein